MKKVILAVTVVSLLAFTQHPCKKKFSSPAKNAAAKKIKVYTTISTALMIQLGLVEDNKMVNMSLPMKSW